MVDTLESTPENATHWSRRSMAAKSGSVAVDDRPYLAGLRAQTAPHRRVQTVQRPDVRGTGPRRRRVVCGPTRGRGRPLRGRKVPGAGAGPVAAGVPDDAGHAGETHPRLRPARHHQPVRGVQHRRRHRHLQPARRHPTVEFRKFPAKIDTEVPADLDIHLVCDNYGTHKTPAIRKWLAAIPDSTCISPPPIPAGSTKSSGGSPTSPNNSSATVTTAPCKPWKPTSEPGSKPGTTTRNPSPGTRTAEQILSSIGRLIQRVNGAGH